MGLGRTGRANQIDYSGGVHDIGIPEAARVEILTHLGLRLVLSRLWLLAGGDGDFELG